MKGDFAKRFGKIEIPVSRVKIPKNRGDLHAGYLGGILSENRLNRYNSGIKSFKRVKRSFLKKNAPIKKLFLKDNLVAGDRLNLYHLQQATELIDVGTWQIALKNAIKDYLPEVDPPAPANDALTGSKMTREAR